MNVLPDPATPSASAPPPPTAASGPASSALAGQSADVWDKLIGKKVLVTGGLGFIASNLARRLVAGGAEVTLVDSLIPKYGGNLFNVHDIRERVHVNIADVRDPHSMSYLVQGQDYLFNLAGQTCHLDSMRDPQTDLEINCRAQLSILEACRQHNPGVKIIFTSTRQIYGAPRYLPVDEAHPLCPVDVNGVNKLAGENYHLVYHRAHGLRTCILRLTNTYGPRMRVKDDRQTFLGIWFKRLLEGEPILVFGDGRQLRDFNYVEDVVDALLLAAVNPAADGQIYNLGAGDQISLGELARLLVELQGGGETRLVPFPPERKRIDIGSYHADYRAIRSALGWEPRVPLAEGLARTLRYFAAHRDHYWDAQPV